MVAHGACTNGCLRRRRCQITTARLTAKLAARTFGGRPRGCNDAADGGRHRKGRQLQTNTFAGESGAWRSVVLHALEPPPLLRVLPQPGRRLWALGRVVIGSMRRQQWGPSPVEGRRQETCRRAFDRGYCAAWQGSRCEGRRNRAKFAGAMGGVGTVLSQGASHVPVRLQAQTEFLGAPCVSSCRSDGPLAGRQAVLASAPEPRRPACDGNGRQSGARCCRQSILATRHAFPAAMHVLPCPAVQQSR